MRTILSDKALPSGPLGGGSLPALRRGNRRVAPGHRGFADNDLLIVGVNLHLRIRCHDMGLDPHRARNHRHRGVAGIVRRHDVGPRHGS
ncbi:unnamed protein product, partial [Mesorhabditis spiculigera]